MVAENLADLQRKLDTAARAIELSPDDGQSSPTGWWYGRGTNPGKLAFLFPGQGSQYCFMGADLAMAFDHVREVWEWAAAHSVDGKTGLHERVFPFPVFSDADRQAQEALLTATEWAQPAIGITSLSMLTLMRTLGLEPDCAGGHSFGEVTALCAAGVLDAADFLKVAHKRGEFMAEAASQPGSMTAVSHPGEELRQLLAAWGSDVVLANHNAPLQSVLSGRTEALAECEVKLGEMGIRYQRLPVATAFHSEIVSSASKDFKNFLADIPFWEACIPVYTNCEATPYPEDADAKRSVLADAIAQPVRFVEQIEAMAAMGVKTFLEVGPGGILTTLVGDILGDRALGIALDRKGQSGLTSFWRALGQLAARGFSLDFAPLLEPLAPIDDPRTKPTPNLALPLSGVNDGKPYPPSGSASALPPPNPPRPVEQEISSMVEVPPLSLSTPRANQYPNNGHVVQSPDVQEVNHTPEMPPQAPAAPPPPTVVPTAEVAEISAREALQWVEAFQNLQQQTTDAHMAFLRVAERSLIGLESLLTGRSESVPSSSDIPTVSPTAEPQATEKPERAQSSQPVEPVTPVVSPAMPVSPAPSPKIDLATLMLEVVFEKTGYPANMIEMDM